MKRWGVLTVIGALAAAFTAGSAWAQGGASPVAANAARILSFGTDLQVNQPFATSSQDRAHVVFADGSSLAVGPSSVMVIEKYAYDAQRKTGEMTVNATQGAFRFVGGAISKSADVIIRTPSSTIGIRGGIAGLTIKENGATTADFLYGNAMHVTGQGATQTATRSGSQINVALGGAPTQPALLRPGQFLDNVTMPPSTTGQPVKVPIDDALAKSALARQQTASIARSALQQAGLASFQQQLTTTVANATRAGFSATIPQPQAQAAPAPIPVINLAPLPAPVIAAAPPVPTASLPVRAASPPTASPAPGGATVSFISGGGFFSSGAGGTIVGSGSLTITRSIGASSTAILSGPTPTVRK